MPELPEVEVCRRNLARWSARRRIVGVSLVDPASVRRARSSRPAVCHEGVERVRGLVGQRAGVLLRHGKRLAWCFEHTALLLHLGMTGRWVRRVGGEEPRWGRVGLHLDDGAVLWFVDPRRFGYLVALPAGEVEAALHEGLGPDALDEAPGGEALAARLKTRKPVKVALLDQHRLAGLGNIHAVEALFRAGVHPGIPAERLDAASWERLAGELPDQLRRAVVLTEADEVAYMSDGAHVENPFEVYDRAGAPCRVCGTLIQREAMAGRSTFWCPTCQPLPVQGDAPGILR